MSLINIGLTGIQSHQRALETTGNNVTNANTDGYSRQRVDFATNPSQPTGDGFLGQGVNIADIRRLNDEFINTQLRSDTTLHAEQSALASSLGELDNLLGNENTGLNRSLTDFFTTLQSAAEDPSSRPLREQVISQAESLQTRFSSLDTNLRERETNIDKRISSDISEINSLAGGIAELNRAIAEAPGRAQGREANELLDQRDEKLRQLSELVQVQANDNRDGTIDVAIGKGQGLVSGANASKLALTDATEKAGRRDVVIEGSGSQRIVTGEIVGGSLGGHLRFRDEVLEPTINSIGRLAIGVAEKLNEQHELGMTLDGFPGGLFFGDVNDEDVASRRVTPFAGNAAPDDREASVTITDSSKLDARSFELEFTGPGDRDFALKDSVTGDEVKRGRLPENDPARISMPGFDINIESGSFQSGDRFLVRPTFNGARDLNVAIQDGDDLALAAPIRSETADGNLGTGSINQGTMLDVRDPVTGRELDSINDQGELTPPMVVRFISETRYEVLDASDPANLKPLEPPINNERFVPGTTNKVFSDDPGSRRITTQGDALTTIGSDGDNGFGGQELTVRRRDSDTGRVTEETIGPFAPNTSARDIAQLLGNANGVETTAYTELRLANFDGDGDTSLTVTVGGEDVELEVDGNFTADSVEQAIRDSETFSSLGITAVSDGQRLTLRSDTGEDISVELNDGNALDVEKMNPYDDIVAATEPLADGENATVGGVIDVTMADGVRVNADNSNVFNRSPSSESAYLGFQFEIEGRPEREDRFFIESNQGGTSDNRNGLEMGDFKSRGVLDGGDKSFNDAYSAVVEDVGSKTRNAQVDEEASKTLKEQSQERWEAQSGVNLDEEAGKIIQFRAAYNASAQVVSVARDLFDTLLATFR